MPHRYTIISPRRAGCRMAGHITTDHRLNITICQNGAASACAKPTSSSSKAT